MKIRRIVSPMLLLAAACLVVVVIGMRAHTERFITPETGLGYLLGIIGASAMLVLQHFGEGWSVSLRQKRLAGLAAGSVVGVAASCLAAWLGVEHRLETMNRPLPGAENAFRMALDQHMLSYAMMGGLSLAIPKWWSLVDRERPSRWGMKSLVRWGIWGLIISQI